MSDIRIFSNPNHIIDSFKSSAKYVRKLIEDPSIGIEKVERILDAAHAIKYQVPRYTGIKYKTQAELLQTEKIKAQDDPDYKANLEKFPLVPEYNLLKFIAENSKKLHEWERNLLLIVEESSQYFIPQALTKIMNEGWACTIHHKIVNELTSMSKRLYQLNTKIEYAYGCNMLDYTNNTLKILSNKVDCNISVIKDIIEDYR